MWDSLRLAAFFLLLTNLFHFSLSLPVQIPLKCNGHAELCDRKYGNTTFLGSHDSFSISDNPWILARNQEISLSRQLELGVRLLQVQLHMHNDEAHFCHTSCLLFDGGSVESYLSKVKSFLDKHPGEVITLIIANPEEVTPKSLHSVFDRSGLGQLVYTPPKALMKRDDWPTLGEMVNAGKRVIVFMDKGFAPDVVDPSSDSSSQAPLASTTTRPYDYILPQFPMLWEDPYDPDDIDFACRVDRTQGPLKPEEQLNLINHNLNINLMKFPFGSFGHGLRIPNRGLAQVTNRVSSIVDHANNCAKFVNGKNPNFVLLDWVNVGNGAKAVDALNGFR